jgi:hypothetical protein
MIFEVMHFVVFLALNSPLFLRPAKGGCYHLLGNGYIATLPNDSFVEGRFPKCNGIRDDVEIVLL